jgi:hypothetical protein
MSGRDGVDACNFRCSVLPNIQTGGLRMVRSICMTVGVVTLLSQAACGKTPSPESVALDNQTSATGLRANASRPLRREGLWEETIHRGPLGLNSYVVRICLDRAADEKLAFAGEPWSRPCRRTAMPRGDRSWVFTSTCDRGGRGELTSEGTVTGDLRLKYRVDVEVTTAGAAEPEMNGTDRLTTEAQWKGNCPADMKPGDIDVNRTRFNVLHYQGESRLPS